jgi:REP-associated tyrosine transposase
MAKPNRNSGASDVIAGARTFFVTSKTCGAGLLQSERMAELLIDVLRSYAAAGKFKVHDFVVMPDHLHVLLTVGESSTIEKAVQFIKGGFSFRVKKELGYLGEVWQRGFSEVRVMDRESFLRHRIYIDENPVKARLVDTPEKFPFGSAYFKKQKVRRG